MTTTWRGLAAMFLLASAWLAGSAHAASRPWGTDVTGGADHPMISRYAGSWLIGYRSSDWDATVMPTGAAVDDTGWKQTLALEGKVTRLLYLAPQGKSRLEVYRNYEQALAAAGFKRVFACEADCSKLYFAFERSGAYRKGLRWAANGHIPQAGTTSRYSLTSALSPEEGRLLYGTLNRGGRDVHVLLYHSVAANETTDVAATYLEIVEPKAMPTGQVTVDAKAMQASLGSEGKVALYGIHFDSGKAEIKPESKPQLDEMAKLLQSQPALKVYIVGHTDNQGALATNLTLSQQRADAVAHALSGAHKIDAKRLHAKGVASLAPVATNADDAGRAKNRRVELVVQ